MEAVQLTAEVRDESGKNSMSQLRRQGYLPAVLYSKEVGNIVLKLPAKESGKVISNKGDSALYQILITKDGKQQQYATLLREVQRHPVKGELIHVDFYQVSMKLKLTTAVPLHFIGEPEGTRKGGILQYGIREVEVECLPTNLPENLTVDVSALDFGDTVTVADLIVPEGVEVVSEPETVVASIFAPRVEAKEGDAEAAEPEAETPEGEE